MRQHRDGIAQGVVGQIGQLVPRFAQRREVCAEPAYGAAAVAPRPGPRREPPQPADQLIDQGLDVGHAGEANRRVRGEWVLSARPG